MDSLSNTWLTHSLSYKRDQLRSKHKNITYFCAPFDAIDQKITIFVIVFISKEKKFNSKTQKIVHNLKGFLKFS